MAELMRLHRSLVKRGLLAEVATIDTLATSPLAFAFLVVFLAGALVARRGAEVARQRSDHHAIVPRIDDDQARQWLGMEYFRRAPIAVSCSPSNSCRSACPASLMSTVTTSWPRRRRPRRRGASRADRV